LKINEKLFLIPVLILIVSCANKAGLGIKSGQTLQDSKEVAYVKLQDQLRKGPFHQFVLAPEGEFICVFNPVIRNWIEKKWDLHFIREMRNQLKPTLKISLTSRGFVKAANRELVEGQEKDETNYDAVWVRDSAWVFWNLQETGKGEDARKLLLALWDYYSSPDQQTRFKAVINNPSLVMDKMAVPHIRFDGGSPTFQDVQAQGKPEVWNHRQMDAHGLFLMSLLQAVKTGMVKERDFTEERIKAISLFPAFFDAVKFWDLEDAGAWEEIDRRNSSSIAIVTRAMLQLGELQKRHPNIFTKINNAVTVPKQKVAFLIKPLAENGLKTVRAQIQRGGESPVYDPYKNPSLFRRADAALFNVILPTPLAGISESELRLVLTILESLKRPAGLLRYQNDSYQSGNFWIQEPGSKNKEGTVGNTGDTSDQNAFKERLAALIPHTEAQWFFDSYLAMARIELYKLALKQNNKAQAEQDMVFAQLHLKRALGQITGQINNRVLLAADGLPVKDWLTPESINTVFIDGKTYYLPSPITPLNWAKAALDMGMFRLEQIAGVN
jgi:hypothetical protein